MDVCLLGDGCVYIVLVCHLRYRDSVDNTVEENSIVFLIRMRWLPSARACGQ